MFAAVAVRENLSTTGVSAQFTSGRERERDDPQVQPSQRIDDPRVVGVLKLLHDDVKKTDIVEFVVVVGPS